MTLEKSSLRLFFVTDAQTAAFAAFLATLSPAQRAALCGEFVRATQGRTWADATQRELTAAAADLGVAPAEGERTFAEVRAELAEADPSAAWLRR